MSEIFPYSFLEDDTSSETDLCILDDVSVTDDITSITGLDVIETGIISEDSLIDKDEVIKKKKKTIISKKEVQLFLYHVFWSTTCQQIRNNAGNIINAMWIYQHSIVG